MLARKWLIVSGSGLYTQHYVLSSTPSEHSTILLIYDIQSFSRPTQGEVHNQSPTFPPLPRACPPMTPHTAAIISPTAYNQRLPGVMNPVTGSTPLVYHGTSFDSISGSAADRPLLSHLGDGSRADGWQIQLSVWWHQHRPPSFQELQYYVRVCQRSQPIIDFFQNRILVVRSNGLREGI